MLAWVLIFLALALIAGLFGFTNIAVASAKIAQILFIIFIVLFVASLIMYGTGINVVLLTWAIIFLIISIIAGIFGFWGTSRFFGDVAKIIFIVFLVLFIVSIIMHFSGSYAPPVQTPAAPQT